MQTSGLALDFILDSVSFLNVIGLDVDIYWFLQDLLLVYQWRC
jgi:hypothetical protein